VRLPYLACLFAVQCGAVEDEDIEPPVPAGLSQFGPALRAIADFLKIDEILIAAAAEAGPGPGTTDQGSMAEWIAALPSPEKDPR
jgi:hypothetical protein